MFFPKRKVIMVVWLCSFLPSTSCAMSSAKDLTGCLVYADRGKNIRKIDLKTLRHEVLYEGPGNVTSIDHFSKTGPDKFLFEECNGLRTPNCLLMEFDLTNRTVSILRSGRMPTYIAERDSVFFYDRIKDDGEQWLLVARRGAMDAATEVAKAPGVITFPNGLGFFPGGPVVQVSTDEVVFVGEDWRLMIYDMANGQVRSTGLNHKSPRIWRSQTQQLIARDWETKAFYQINLKKGDVKKLPQLGRRVHSGLGYLPEYDTLIYSMPRFSFIYWHETSDIFAYHYKTEKKVKLLPHGSISSGIWWSCSDL